MDSILSIGTVIRRFKDILKEYNFFVLQIFSSVNKLIYSHSVYNFLIRIFYRIFCFHFQPSHVLQPFFPFFLCEMSCRFSDLMGHFCGSKNFCRCGEFSERTIYWGHTLHMSSSNNTSAKNRAPFHRSLSSCNCFDFGFGSKD